MSKKFIITIGIIVIAILFLIFSKKDKGEETVLPTRDTDTLESYASIEEFCQDLTDSQEFDDFDREASFYETCLLQYQ